MSGIQRLRCNIKKAISCLPFRPMQKQLALPLFEACQTALGLNLIAMCSLTTEAAATFQEPAGRKLTAGTQIIGLRHTGGVV